jgi:hypothetical protein
VTREEMKEDDQLQGEGRQKEEKSRDEGVQLLYREMERLLYMVLTKF